jgi:hypothetical protein
VVEVVDGAIRLVPVAAHELLGPAADAARRIREAFGDDESEMERRMKIAFGR